MIDALIYISFGLLGAGSVWLFLLSKPSIGDYNVHFSWEGVFVPSYDSSDGVSPQGGQGAESFQKLAPPSRINLYLEPDEVSYERDYPGDSRTVFSDVKEETSEAEEETASEESEEPSEIISGDDNVVLESGSNVGSASHDEWEEEDESVPEKEYELNTIREASINLEGSASIPTRVYANDSHRVKVELIQEGAPDIQAIADVEALEDDENAIPLSLSFTALSEEDTRENVLEVELHSAGIEINSEATQRRSLVSEHLTYQWNCLFSNSGDHFLDLEFRQFTGEDVVHVGKIERQVKVVRLANLTSRQVQTISYFCGGVAGVVGFIKVLQELGVF